MPVDEYARWCAYLRMQNQTGQSTTTGKGSKITAFRNKLAKMGYYKNIGYRK